jgi:hypothetical protein
MGKAKDPDYQTGRRGKNWTTSLLHAQEKGAIVVHIDTGEVLRYDKKNRFRRWVSLDGKRRYDSTEVKAVF